MSAQLVEEPIGSQTRLESIERPSREARRSLIDRSGQDSWKMDIEKLKAKKISPEELKKMPPRLRRFYKRHNQLVDDFERADMGQAHASPEDIERHGKIVKLAIYVSMTVNVILFILNVYNAVISHSLAVLAAAIDSFLDILSGSLIWLTSIITERTNQWDYPAGKSRFEPLGMIVFSSVMFSATLQLLIQGVEELIRVYGSTNPKSDLDFKLLNYIIIAVGVTSKLLLWLWCRTIPNSLSARTLAADHINDVVLNGCGTVFAVVGFFATTKWWGVRKGGWIDPTGAILIALYIMLNWGRTGWQYVKLLSGRAAPPDFLSTVTYLCWNHDQHIIQIDTVRAFRLAEGYIVEVDVVLPKHMPLHQAHDIGESLQFRIEDLDGVERAFVHLDYETGHKPEH